MIVSEVTSFAYATCVQLAVVVLALLGHLVATLGVVTILAHSRGVVVVVDVLALGYYFPVLDLTDFFIGLRGVFARFLLVLAHGGDSATRIVYCLLN